jgi:hypothetical protein
MKEVEVENFKFGEMIFNKVRFVGDTDIIARTKKELHDKVNRLVDTRRKYDMEINIDKSHVMRISRSNESLQIKVNNRELKEVDNIKYLGRVLNKRRLLQKGNQDENCRCQRII